MVKVIKVNSASNTAQVVSLNNDNLDFFTNKSDKTVIGWTESAQGDNLILALGKAKSNGYDTFSDLIGGRLDGVKEKSNVIVQFVLDQPDPLVEIVGDFYIVVYNNVTKQYLDVDNDLIINLTSENSKGKVLINESFEVALSENSDSGVQMFGINGDFIKPAIDIYGKRVFSSIA